MYGKYVEAKMKKISGTGRAVIGDTGKYSQELERKKATFFEQVPKTLKQTLERL